MSGPLSQDDKLLVEAYIDGELDAVAAIGLERRMAGEPLLKAHHERVAALGGAVRGVARERLSEEVRTRILAMALGETEARPLPTQAVVLRHAPRRFDLRQMAASVVAAAVIASGSTALVTSRLTVSSDVSTIIAGHQRALLAASAYDVASSDKHTVKPWFDSKLAISPSVPDLSDAGFPLLGGRVEVVGGKPVPTMVYRRRGHLISVVAIPKAGAAEQDVAESRIARDGFLAESWSGQGFVYTAVSDLGPEELELFCETWRREAKAQAKA